MATGMLDRRSAGRSSHPFMFLSTLVAISTAALQACAAPETTNREIHSTTVAASNRDASTESALHGIQLVYRFASGRTYRAAYGIHDVTFELLEPRLEPPPGKTMPYTIQTLRPGLHFVVWMDPEFYTTFVIDLDRKRLHASALRDREGLFVSTAEIIEIARPPENTGTK